VRSAGGSPQVLATGVLSFDLAEGGSVVYSNGSAVFRLDPSGTSTRLVKDALIAHVVAVPPAPPSA